MSLLMEDQSVKCCIMSVLECDAYLAFVSHTGYFSAC
jgi:hypothetical protein